MAGLYDDLPEPANTASEQAASSAAAGFNDRAPGDLDLVSDKVRPVPTGASLLFRLDDASVHSIFGFLALPELGKALPAACQPLLWLRDAWMPWRRFLAPLRRRQQVQVVKLLRTSARSLDELAGLARAAEDALQGFDRAKRVRLLGGVGKFVYSFGELPMPRVLWSLHSEGYSAWEDACSLVTDAQFSLLPPWNRADHRAPLPRQVRVRLGISLWLPPDSAAQDPGLCLNAKLEDAQAFEDFAKQIDRESTVGSVPPCLAATCDAVLFRPSSGCSASRMNLDNIAGEIPRSAILEEWSLRFCFGPGGYRHSGHGEMDGYKIAHIAPGQRKWRPPDLCYMRVGERPQDSALHLLLRMRRSEGLLD